MAIKIKKNLVSYVLLFILIATSSYAGCIDDDKPPQSTQTPISNEEKESNDSNLSNGQNKVLKGAKQNLKDASSYDLTMGYYVLKYKDGVLTESQVYPDGDLDPLIGVCTDVIIRSLRNGGVTDLQEEIHEDIVKSKTDYPYMRGSKADYNIDHRRVVNLEVWFDKYWQRINNHEFMPGDIVVWDMNEDGKSEHIGIVSDKIVDGRYFVIHSHQDPGHVAEEDKLFKWKITGHYRIKE